MIEAVSLENFGMHAQIDWKNLSKINLLIGENGTGKTYVLKSMYSALKSLEQYKRGDDKRSLAEILSENLYWTFQPRALGELVRREVKGRLHFDMVLDGKSFSYEFGKDTIKRIVKLNYEQKENRKDTSVFIPAKEVLSLFQIILKSRDQDHSFGFDNTYLDLVRALQLPRQRGNNFQGFSQARQELEKLLGGAVEYNSETNQWYYRQKKDIYMVGETAEGVKKLAIFNQLLANRYLNRNSIVFMDEIESSLHPKAIVEFLNIIERLADSGLQFFIATHSYFVIKKLCLMARENKMHIPVLSLENDKSAKYFDMLDGMPENSIIQESIRLYEAETDFEMGVSNV